MKKFYALIPAILLTSLVYAQPVINSSHFPGIGTTIVDTELDAATLSEGSGGANQTWNFMNAVSLGNANQVDYVAASVTPFITNFPLATIAGAIDPNGTVAYSYYNATSALVELLGVATNQQGIDLIFTYSNPQTVMQFPTNSTTTWSDTYEASYSITNMGITVSTYRSGIANFASDGYGTLITPLATYTNVLRVKMQQAHTDSMVYVGIPLPPEISTYSSTSYNWFSADAGDLLNQFFISYDTTISQQGNSDNKTAFYQSLNSTSINQVIQQENSIVTFPNPTINMVQLLVNNMPAGDVQINVTDVTGKLVRTIPTKNLAKGKFNIVFDTDGMQKGIYAVTVIGGDTNYTTRIIKQ